MKLNKLLIILSIISLILVTFITAKDSPTLELNNDNPEGEQQLVYGEIIVKTNDLNVKCNYYEEFIRCDECNYDGDCSGTIEDGESYIQIDTTDKKPKFKYFGSNKKKIKLKFDIKGIK